MWTVIAPLRSRPRAEAWNRSGGAPSKSAANTISFQSSPLDATAANTCTAQTLPHRPAALPRQRGVFAHRPDRATWGTVQVDARQGHLDLRTGSWTQRPAD